MQPDLGVHRKCEVNRRRTLRQLMHVALRREHKDLLGVQVELEELEELIGRLGIELQLENLTKPGEVLVELVVVLDVLLVAPVRRDAEVGGPVHPLGADLDLIQLPAGAEHRGVQGLVAVRLRLRDVVLDALLDRCVAIVDDAERVIAVRHGVDEHADREQVEDLLVRLVAMLHLLVDRPQVLWPTRHLDVLHARAGESALERLAQREDQGFALTALLRDLLRERLVVLGLEVLEGEVLEFPPHLRHAEAMRERGIEVAGLLRDATLLLRGEKVERAHVVQPIRQLHDDDARVLRDREQELAVALHLPVLIRAAVGQLGDLRQSIDDGRDLLPELALDVVDRPRGVLDHVVNQPAGHRGRIELQVGEDLCDLDAVRDIRLTRIPRLPAMGFLGEAIGARQQFLVEAQVRALVEAPVGNDFAQRSRHADALTRPCRRATARRHR